MGSCCGNDKAGSVPPSATSGRKRSVLLLLMSIAMALLFQYIVGPRISQVSIGNFVTDAWTEGCTGFSTDALQERCVGNNGVYRATSSVLIFFLLLAITAYVKPTYNREAWPAKYILYVFLAAAMCFVPNDPYFGEIYLNIARVGGVLFIIIQQIIILDIAWNWNEVSFVLFMVLLVDFFSHLLLVYTGLG